jgi:hypothetical protein
MTSTTSYCGSCGAANLGTRFCETCGTALTSTAVAQMQMPDSGAPAASSEAMSTSVRGAENPSAPTLKTAFGLYLGAYALGGLVAIVNALAFAQLYRGGTSWTNVVDALLLVASIAPALALLMALLPSTVTTARKSWSLVLVSINPVLIGLNLFLALTNAFFFYSSPVYSLSLLLSGLVPVFAFLAWVLVAGYPGRAFAALPIVFVFAVLSFFVGGRGYNSAQLVIIATLLDVGGVVLALLLARRLARRYPNAQSVGNQSSVTFSPGAGRTNALSILALIFGLLGGTVLPIVLGHIARSQIRRTGESGDGLALAGLILGYVSSSVVVVILIVAFASAAGSGLHL